MLKVGDRVVVYPSIDNRHGLLGKIIQFSQASHKMYGLTTMVQVKYDGGGKYWNWKHNVSGIKVLCA